MKAEENKNIKKPKTFVEQIQILKSRSLTIDNDEEAICILKKIYYYRLSAYMLTHKTKDGIYDGVFPIWVVIEVTSFGVLSKMYNNLLDKDKDEIAKEYYNTKGEFVRTWLHSLSNIRNKCAHYGRLLYFITILRCQVPNLLTYSTF